MSSISNLRRVRRIQLGRNPVFAYSPTLEGFVARGYFRGVGGMWIVLESMSSFIACCLVSENCECCGCDLV